MTTFCTSNSPKLYLESAMHFRTNQLLLNTHTPYQKILFLLQMLFVANHLNQSPKALQ